jgi:hypothetical protein
MTLKANIDWTHQSVEIIDIRKLNKLYVIKIHVGKESLPITSALFVKDNIFEERLKSYFLKDVSKISREEILSVNWNMYITKGYFVKINDRGDVEKFDHDAEKWYISYLEIAGPLGTFCSIYRDKELNKQ